MSIHNSNPENTPRKPGRPLVNGEGRKMLSVRLPAATVQKIRELADARDTSQANIIAMAVDALSNSAARPGAETETKEVAAVPAEAAEPEDESFTEQDIERIITEEYAGASRKEKRKMRRVMLKKLRKIGDNGN